jgi:hypothetical protein
MRVVEAQHMTIAIGLVVKTLAHDHLRHGDQGGRIGRGPDEDVLVGERHAGAGAARVDADDAYALLLCRLEVLQGAGAEGAVARAPAPHQDQLRVDVVGRLAAGGLVFGLGAEGHADGEDLGLRRHVRPQGRAAAELVQKALGNAAAMQHRQAARPRTIENRGVAVFLADAQHPRRHMIERLVPRDALELPRAARARAAHRMLEPIRMIDPFELADAAGTGMERRQFGLPARRVGRDPDDAIVHDVRVHHASAAAIVPAGAGDHRLARPIRPTRLLVDRLIRHACYSRTMAG